MAHSFDVVIIGGGILGTSISYFLSFLNKSKKIVVIEQAHNVAFHTSGRKTGKVHAPYLYNPEKKKLFAKSAFQEQSDIGIVGTCHRIAHELAGVRVDHADTLVITNLAVDRLRPVTNYAASARRE